MLLDENNHVKICDFGLASFVASQPFSGFRPGKPGYMAPEIFQNKPFNGYECDVYSCGVILFTMLFGFPPYKFASEMADARFAMIYSGHLNDLLNAWWVMGMR